MATPFYIAAAGLGTHTITFNYTDDIILALDETLKEAVVTLYPNPADRQLIIKPGKKLAKEEKAIIFDNTGKQVAQISLPHGQDLIELNTLNFKPGIYLFTLPTETGAITKRFVISHR